MIGRKLWVILLAVWLVLWGLLSVSNFSFKFQDAVMGFLAIVAGVLLAMDR